MIVRDDGVGIPAADVAHVFDRFHRGANVVGRFAGSGLGLASARELVELHGGTISVDSEEGEGSTFVVRLPLTPPGTLTYSSGRQPALDGIAQRPPAGHLHIRLEADQGARQRARLGMRSHTPAPE